MKTLTIRQPWAWLIVRPDIVGDLARVRAAEAGEMKAIENRSLRTHRRGDFLIHAALGMTRGEYADVAAFLQRIGQQRVLQAMPGFDAMPRGGIVGVADLTGCVESHPSPYFFGPFGYTLANVRALPFTPCKGMLGFWNAPDDVCAAIRGKLEGTAC